MANLFSGLESMGLGNLSNMDVYEKEETVVEEETIVRSQQDIEAEVIFDKSYTCPLCDKQFKSKTVKTGKVKLASLDSDLRPKYHTVDSLKYDVVDCPSCGYAALDRFFPNLTSGQAKLIKANISATYKSVPVAGDILTYEEAITKYKLSLVNTIVKKGRVSERAYNCLKIAWLLRGKKESLVEKMPDYKAEVTKLETEEAEFMNHAFDGFKEAYAKENFPMCGMDEITITYLLADVARRIGKYDEASRYVSKVITSREAKERIKDMARTIKEQIAEIKGKK